MTGVTIGSDGDWAITVTAPRTVACLPAQRPRRPLGPDEVEGRTLASLVSPGTELNWYYDPDLSAGATYPIVPGYAAVFEVERVGPQVRSIECGDRVLDPSGQHASWQRRSAERLVQVPQGVAPSTATFARLMAVSMATLSTTPVRPPEPIGVSGLGLVGHLAAKIMAASGYDVTAWDTDAARRALLEDVGINVVQRAPVPDGYAYDDPAASGDLSLVLDCRGGARSVLDSCAAVRHGGEVVLVGVPWRPTEEITAHELLRVVFHRYVSIRSGWEYQVEDSPTRFRGASTRANLEAALRWLASGRVRVDGLATCLDPELAADAYAALRARTWPTLSVVFDWARAAT